MLHDIFTNTAILVAFLLVVGQFFKNNSFNTKQTIKIQVLLGMIFGTLGMALMLFTIRITDTVIIDLRNISIICAGIMGGPISAVISALINAVFRIAYFGISAASIVAFSTALAVGAGTACISNMKLKRLNKYIFMFIFSMTASNIALTYLLKISQGLFETLSYYWQIYILGALVTYFTCEYIIAANLNYKTMSYYKMTSDNLSDMISINKPGGKIIFVSASLHQLFGYTPDEFIGTSAYKYIHPEDIDKVKEAYSNLSVDKENSMQMLRMKCKDGRYVWVETSVKTVRNNDGTIKEMVCVTRDISSRKEIEQELQNARLRAEKLASTDYLTGLLNRRAFEERFNDEASRVKRDKTYISVILTDIDHFKKVNDTYGHKIGDMALQKFSQCLSNACRPYDFIGRHGGEEFIICLPDTDYKQAVNTAERMRKIVEKLPVNIGNDKEPIMMTASFGVASTLAIGENSIKSLVSKADRAMYKAKAEGRNRVCCALEE